MHRAQESRVSRIVRPVLLVAVLYGCWLGMMLMHECGHVLHAWASGAKVERVVLPLLGFSRTDLAENPRPLFVSWGGAVWGSLLPLVLLAIACAIRLRYWRVCLFFAGFCLIANGAYLAFGSFCLAGDAGDLLQHGAPQWTLFLYGAVTMPLGLLLWHWLGPRLGLGNAAKRSWPHDG
jgi:hypothetical protein